MGPMTRKPVEKRVLYILQLEGERDLVLLDAAGREQRRVVLSDSTLRNHTADEVAADLITTLVYEMKDQQGAEDARR